MKALWSIPVIFLLTGLLGAMAAPSGSLMLDPQGPVLAAASERAAEEWAHYGENVVVDTSNGAVQVQWNPELNLNGMPIAAGVYESGDRIEVNSAMYRPGVDCLWCAIFHEIGHLLGYEHGDGHYGLRVG